MCPSVFLVREVGRPHATLGPMARELRLGRRDFLAVTTSAVALGMQEDSADSRPTTGFVRHDVAEWGVEGRGWEETERFYSRLPQRAKEKVRPVVWRLGQHTAGMAARFRTSATNLNFNVKLNLPDLDMVHMPATGVSGVDLYASDGAGWRWVACGMPRTQEYQLSVAGVRDGEREYLLYLPLYNGVESLTIDVPEGARFKRVLPRREPPIVYYGTSIAQGACASRPGMAFTNILHRRLDTPVLNLGFSGNGRMEAEVGALIAEIEASCYVIDCLPNMGPEDVSARAGPLVRQLRAARPETPILLVEDRRMPSSVFLPARDAFHDKNQAALRRAHEELAAEGVTDIHYLADVPFLGTDGEGTVDASHPSDLGMMRYADALESVLKPLLGAR